MVRILVATALLLAFVAALKFGLNQAFLPYSSQSPFGFSGRFVYGRVSIDF